MLGHDIVALHFSGGKDSLATLYLMRPHWDDITVMWCNTGDSFPETRLQMDAIKQMVPHFIEVTSDQPAQTSRNGYPSDALSAWDAPLGVAVFEGRPYRAQSPLGCCMENVLHPLLRATRMLGATLVIKGQRTSDVLKSTLRSGAIEDGVEYLFPIEDWTDEQVRVYLQDQGVPLPPHYTFINSSLDCQHCTGYLFEPSASARFAYLRNHHPELHKQVVHRVRENTLAVAWETRHAQAILAEHYSE